MMSSKTYRIELFSYTTKGKTNHIDDIFITSDADKEQVTKYYTEKYKPLKISVTELETIEVNLPEGTHEEISIEKTNSGSMYNDPEYRIARSSLPKEVQGWLEDLDTHEKTVSEVKKKINGLMFPYFSSGGAMQRYDKDSIVCRGYIKPLTLTLTKAKDE
jgi:hypothetical protein